MASNRVLAHEPVQCGGLCRSPSRAAQVQCTALPGHEWLCTAVLGYMAIYYQKTQVKCAEIRKNNFYHTPICFTHVYDSIDSILNYSSTQPSISMGSCILYLGFPDGGKMLPVTLNGLSQPCARILTMYAADILSGLSELC